MELKAAATTGTRRPTGAGGLYDKLGYSFIDIPATNGTHATIVMHSEVCGGDLYMHSIYIYIYM